MSHTPNGGIQVSDIGTIDGIEISITPVESKILVLRDYYVVTSPELPPEVFVAFYRTLTDWTMATSRAGAGRRSRGYRSLDEAREAAIKYAANRVKEARKRLVS